MCVCVSLLMYFILYAVAICTLWLLMNHCNFITHDTLDHNKWNRTTIQAVNIHTIPSIQRKIAAQEGYLNLQPQKNRTILGVRYIFILLSLGQDFN